MLLRDLIAHMPPGMALFCMLPAWAALSCVACTQEQSPRETGANDAAHDATEDVRTGPACGDAHAVAGCTALTDEDAPAPDHCDDPFGDDVVVVESRTEWRNRAAHADVTQRHHLPACADGLVRINLWVHEGAIEVALVVRGTDDKPAVHLTAPVIEHGIIEHEFPIDTTDAGQATVEVTQHAGACSRHDLRIELVFNLPPFVPMHGDAADH